MKYYNKLYKIEQLKLILSLIEEFRWSKIIKDYYRIELNKTKENPKIIRLLKKETIDVIKEHFYYTEQIELISRLIDDFKLIIHNEKYYNYKLNDTKMIQKKIQK